MPRRWPMKRVLMDDLGRESVDVISSFGWTRKVEAGWVVGVLSNEFCYIRGRVGPSTRRQVVIAGYAYVSI